MLKKNVFTILFIGWLIVITSLSLFSFSGLDTGSISIPYADKITHFGFYSGFVVLGCLSVWEWRREKITLKKALWIMVITAIFYGMGIEALQYSMTKDRMAEWGDVLANSIGACIGGLAILWYFTKKEPLKWKL
ncbi:VanZ family protein [Flagellimonas meridianipacifica]|uniref:VanZ like protein n=1 Tax=Flagellimonas meridianipacifica TaxID=1080225 RepID=A0A2T0MJG9_9FLAO|nr:VanZ family protein [Allomuricauda pacifica]PRX57727.1 VanZ like protein [Allomuricauda pacifica]